ncbi:MAG: hypothetical protein ACXWTY_00540 [Methylobacter sp.]
MTDVVIIQQPELITVEAGSAESVVVEVGVPGPPGLSAYQSAVANGFVGTEAEWLVSLVGASGGSVIQLIAGIDLGGNRVVTAAAVYADSADITTAGNAIGITAGAASQGSLVDIATTSELDGFFGLTADQPVYLSVSGTVTQIIPTSGYLQRVGVAISTTKLLINISEPIVL